MQLSLLTLRRLFVSPLTRRPSWLVPDKRHISRPSRVWSVGFTKIAP